MAAGRGGQGRRWRWGSLVVALLLFAVAVAVLLAVPSSPLNRAHVGVELTPGRVSLPPTAPPPTATPTHTPTQIATGTPARTATP